MSVFLGLKEALAFAKDAQTLPVLRERLALAQEQAALAEQKTAALEAENAELLRENRELRKQLEACKKEDEYLDLGMCLIKKNPKGGYFDVPLCPSCKKPLSKGMLGRYFCSPCDYHVESMAVDASIRSHI
jgi:hypothetical protein